MTDKTALNNAINSIKVIIEYADSANPKVQAMKDTIAHLEAMRAKPIGTITSDKDSETGRGVGTWDVDGYFYVKPHQYLTHSTAVYNARLRFCLGYDQMSI